MRGVPADLSWRRKRARRLPSRATFVRGVGVTAWAGAYLFLLATYAWGATPFLGLELYGADWEERVWPYAGTSLVLLGLLLAGTVLLLRHRPRTGAATTAAGALGAGVVFPWALVVYGPAGLVVALGLLRHVRRARRRAGRRQPASSAAS